LLLYFSSSWVTTQYRSERVAQRLVLSLLGSDVQIKNWTPAEDNYPRFREAKKAAFDFSFRSAAAINLVPQLGRREFTLLQLYWEHHYSLRVAADRAPPSQA
jgi:hypothetical protein